MVTRSVSNPAELLGALRLASAGDVILLSPGTYSGVTLSGINVAGGVAVRSADLSNPAVFKGLIIANSSGLNFSGVTLEVDPALGHFPNHVRDSSDIRFDNVDVHGSMNGDPSDDMNGIFFQNSRNVSVSHSEFQQLANGVVHSNSNGMAFVGNSFHHIRSDGIKGGGSSDVLISQNDFRDFSPVTGDHPDAIQFWTTNTTATPSNIRILDNVIVQGNGDPIQGIFLGNELGITYKNVIISGNFVYSGGYHGISLYKADGVRVFDNVVLSSAEFKSPIRVVTSTNVEMSGNEASYVFLDSLDVTSPLNVRVPAVQDGGSLDLQEWMAERAASLTDLPLISGSGEPVSGPVTDPTPPPPPPPEPTPEPDPTPTPEPTPEPVPAPEDMIILGNGGANTLKGSGGNDSIKGAGGNDKIFGGAGNDILWGQSGRDSFYFDTAPTAAMNRDKIEDFSAADDSILLKKALYDILTNIALKPSTPAAIKAEAFKRIDDYDAANPTSKATDPDASDRIIYDHAGGNIYFDVDGSGAAKAVLFATVDAGTPLTAADFLIFV